jgi:hypothetical protein
MVKRRSFFAALALSVCAMAHGAFGQLSVVSGTGPDYPLKADSIVLMKAAGRPPHVRDSMVTALPPDFLDELKNNVDSVFNYVDAVRLRREEITGCVHGVKYGSCIRFFNEKKQVMKISFPCKRFSVGLLDVIADKYPYAVTFKPEFVKKMERLAARMKRK